jgi:hypothetical protein
MAIVSKTNTENGMKIGITTLVLAAATAGMIGCSSGGRQYTDDRPPVGQLTDGDVGLQSKDVAAATDQMCNSLLAQPALAVADRKWTIVLDRKNFQNETNDPTFSYGVFYTRLQSKIGQLSSGRVALIEDKANFHKLQSDERETPPDTMGQGGGGTGQPAGVQPQYALYITISDMPNRATDYYVINATLTNLQTREMTWTSPGYEVKTAR